MHESEILLLGAGTKQHEEGSFEKLRAVGVKEVHQALLRLKQPLNLFRLLRVEL